MIVDINSNKNAQIMIWHSRFPAGLWKSVRVSGAQRETHKSLLNAKRRGKGPEIQAYNNEGADLEACGLEAWRPASWRVLLQPEPGGLQDAF